MEQGEGSVSDPIKYKGGQKYFHKKKVKYIHNLNLHLVNFGINGKVIQMPFE